MLTVNTDGGGCWRSGADLLSGAFILQVVSKSTAIPRHVNGSGDNSLWHWTGEQKVKDLNRKVLLNYNPFKEKSNGGFRFLQGCFQLPPSDAESL